MAVVDAYRSNLQALLAQREPACSLEIVERSGAPHFEGEIDLPDLEHIKMGYDPRWRWQRYRPLREFCAAEGVDDAVRSTLEFILHHEVNHRQVCPGSPQMGNVLHEAVWNILKPHGKAALTEHAVNLLADILVNARVVDDDHAADDGIMVDWFDQGSTLNSSVYQRLRALLRRPPRPYSPDFAIFVGAQLPLIGNEAAQQLLSPYLPSDDEGIQDAIKEMVALFSAPSVWRDQEMWPDLFQRGAEILVPYLPFTPKRLTSSAHPWLNPDSPDEARRRGSSTWFDPESGRLCSDKPRTPEEKFATLDSYYRQEAKKSLVLQARSPRPRPGKQPKWLSNLAPTQEMEQALSDWGKLDHIAFALDTSGSMYGYGGPRYVPWGVPSRYHHALVALYRLVKWIETQPDVFGLNILNFSYWTRATGWFSTRDFGQKALDTIFSPQRGGTVLDAGELKRQIQACPGEGVLLFILTDGEIANGAALLQTLKDLRPRSLPVLLLADKENDFSKAMREAGFPVYTQVEIEQLDRLVVEEIETRLAMLQPMSTPESFVSSLPFASLATAPTQPLPLTPAPSLEKARHQPHITRHGHVDYTSPMEVEQEYNINISLLEHREEAVPDESRLVAWGEVVFDADEPKPLITIRPSSTYFIFVPQERQVRIVPGIVETFFKARPTEIPPGGRCEIALEFLYKGQSIVRSGGLGRMTLNVSVQRKLGVGLVRISHVYWRPIAFTGGALGAADTVLNVLDLIGRFSIPGAQLPLVIGLVLVGFILALAVLLWRRRPRKYQKVVPAPMTRQLARG